MDTTLQVALFITFFPINGLKANIVQGVIIIKLFKFMKPLLARLHKRKKGRNPHHILAETAKLLAFIQNSF